MKIFVTGGSGQLGSCLASKSRLFGDPQDTWVFLNHDSFDITDFKEVHRILEDERPDVVINCAAYTNVDRAEDDKDNVYKINLLSVINLQEACRKINAYLIHISTDYVVNGELPILIDNQCQGLKKVGSKAFAQNEYGESKRLAEHALSGDKNTLILRTSWLYSEFGNNFLTKIIQNIEKGEIFGVVNDQFGCPTYAMDLAAFIVVFLRRDDFRDVYGLFNYSNLGTASWYDFAKHIENIYSQLRYGKKTSLVFPLATSSLNQKAKRPKFSLLDCADTIINFSHVIPYWTESLEKCIFAYNRLNP